ncbi:MAG TPA: hypothetical protein VFT50_04330 [Baekduia sp.]|nr:hypothetical protein [Baekduia sp.]
MILVAAALMAFGVGDITGSAFRGGGRWPTVGPALAGALAVTGIVAAAGGSLVWVLVGAILALAATAVWRMSCRLAMAGAWPTAVPLGWAAIVLAAAWGCSGSADRTSGPLERWFSGLDVTAPRSVDRFVVAGSVAIFLVASANQVVRLVLQTAGTPASEGESALRGGRFLGPLERLFIAAMVLGGNLTGAAIVIAAKGLLRLPEIRSSEEQSRGATDSVTEYFLIGTFTSLLVAGGLAALVLAAR